MERMMRAIRQDTIGPIRRHGRLRLVVAAIGVGAVLAACGADSATAPTAPEAPEAPAAPAAPEVPAGPEAPAAGAAVTVTSDAALGTFLTDADGRTLYLFTADRPGVSTCEGGCLEAWPPLLTDGEPVAQGAIDAALLGTLTRADGSVQVTYGGWPLYFFAADAAAGDVAGQGVNDVWFVIAPDGTAIDGTDDDGMGGGGTSEGGSGYGY
jgi:predicted lipoprotein with Yx(FWY)xxD motif